MLYWSFTTRSRGRHEIHAADLRRRENLTDEARKHCYAESRELIDELRSRGQYLAASPLQPTASAASVRVRVREGKTLLTNGPFAETREQLGGYYLVEARDLNEAAGITARIPAARWGTVEVRSIIDTPEMP